MRISNKYYLENVLEPLGGYGEYREYDVDYKYINIDENTDEGLRKIVRAALLPSYHDFDAINRRIIKDTLCRVLHDKEFDFEAVISGNFTPWDLGLRSRRLFELMWEEFFPAESLSECQPQEILALDYVNAVRRTGKEGAELDPLLAPFIGGAENLKDPHRFLAPHEEPVKLAFEQRLKPHFISLATDERLKVKTALGEALKCNATCWPWIWKSANPPFDCPHDARELFVWMWAVLFPQEPVPKEGVTH